MKSLLSCKHAPLKLSLAIFVLFFVYTLITSFVSSETIYSDVGYYINYSYRLVYGDLPYKNFWLSYPPGSAYTGYFILKLFHLRIQYLILTNLFITSLTGCLCYLITYRLLKKHIVAIMFSLLVFFNGVLFHFGTLTYLHIYFFFNLLSVYYFLKYIFKKSYIFLLLSSLCLGIAVWFKLWESLGLFFSLLLSILFVKEHLRKKLLGIVLLSSTLLISLFLMTSYFQSLDLNIIKYLILDPLAHSRAASTNYLSSSFNYKDIFVENYMLLSTDPLNIVNVVNSLSLIFYNIIPLPIIVLSLFSLRNKSYSTLEKRIILVFTLWSSILFIKLLTRADVSHVSQALSPLFLPLVIMVYKAISVRKKLSFADIISYALIAYLLLPLSVRFAVIFNKLITPKYQLVTNRSNLIFSNKKEYVKTSQIIKYILKNTTEEDYIFVTPWSAPPFNALTLRRNPTHYDSMLMDFTMVKDKLKQENICNDLVNKHTKLIIHRNFGFDNNPELNFSALNILIACIKSNFVLSDNVSGYEIYTFKDP